MSKVTALDLSTEIRYASSILASELRLMDIESEKGLLLIQGISAQGKMTEFFEIPEIITNVSHYTKYFADN